MKNKVLKSIELFLFAMGGGVVEAVQSGQVSTKSLAVAAICGGFSFLYKFFTHKDANIKIEEKPQNTDNGNG